MLRLSALQENTKRDRLKSGCPTNPGEIRLRQQLHCEDIVMLDVDDKMLKKIVYFNGLNSAESIVKKLRDFAIVRGSKDQVQSRLCNVPDQYRKTDQ